MIPKPLELKAERVQDLQLPVDPERLRNPEGELGNWQVDTTPNAIFRHFPQPSFSASALFLMKVGGKAAKHGRQPFAYVDATGVTIRLGSAPLSGITEADLELAVELGKVA